MIENDERKFSPGFLAKLHTVSGEVAYLQKKGKNTQQNYSYAADADVTTAVGKALHDNKLVMMPPQLIFHEVVFEVQTRGNPMRCSHVRVLFTIADIESGETVSGTMDGYGADPSDKGMNKAITSARKYFFFQTFNIATGDDPEEDVPEQAPVNKGSQANNQNKAIKELQDKIYMTLTTGYHVSNEEAVRLLNGNAKDDFSLRAWLTELQDGLKNQGVATENKTPEVQS